MTPETKDRNGNFQAWTWRQVRLHFESLTAAQQMEALQAEVQQWPRAAHVQKWLARHDRAVLATPRRQHALRMRWKMCPLMLGCEGVWSICLQWLRSLGESLQLSSMWRTLPSCSAPPPIPLLQWTEALL